MKGLCALMIAVACLGACKKGGAKGDAAGASSAAAGTGDAAGAKAMLEAFTKPGADKAALSGALRPKPDDYAQVFDGDAAQKVKAMNDPIWDANKGVLSPSAEQTEIVIAAATPAQLATGEGPAAGCPQAWKDVATKLKPTVTVHCFRFVRPGEKLGYSGDGLVFVNGHWALFPKAFRAFKQAEAKQPEGKQPEK